MTSQQSLSTARHRSPGAGVSAPWQAKAVPVTAARPVERDTRTLLTVAGTIGVFAGFAGTAAHFVASTRPLVLGLAAFAPYLLPGAVVGLVLLALARRWGGVATAALILVFALIGQSALYVASSAPRQGRDLVVMTANLGLGQADPQDVVAAVRRDHVEILMVEELTTYELGRLSAAGLDRALGHRVVAPRGGPAGSGLWSRYPLRSGHEVRGYSFAMVTARVAAPGLQREPTVFAIHMAGPVPSSDYWARDIARLPATLFDQPTDAPVIVGGDFNATTDTPQFRAVLVDGYHDVADQAGSGYPRTWPANRWYPPLIAIDHVLTRDAVGLSTKTVEIRGTDHRALLTKVSVSASV